MTDFGKFFKKNKGYFVLAGVAFCLSMVIVYACCVFRVIDHIFDVSKDDNYKVIAQADMPHAKAIADFNEETFEIDATIIKENVAEVANLSVISKAYLEEVSFEGYKTGSVFGKEFNIPLTKKKMTLGMDVYVNAGVDLSNIKAEDIEVDDMTVYIRLPRAEFLDVYADSESITVCEESSNVLNQVSSEDIVMQMVEAEELARNDAYKDRILDDAEERTAKIISDAVETLYPDHDIEVKVLWASIE